MKVFIICLFNYKQSIFFQAEEADDMEEYGEEMQIPVPCVFLAIC